MHAGGTSRAGRITRADEADHREKLTIAPVVKGVELPPQILERVAYGDGKEAMLFVSDWEFLINIRPEWTERWNTVFS
jgi:hypothetical protein